MKTSSKIIMIYLFVGIVWIFASDRSFAYLGFDDSLTFQTLKGVSFILISGFVFWRMIVAYEKKNELYINQQKKFADDLQHSNDRFEVVTSITNNIIWDYDFDTKMVHWGQSLTDLFGYKDRIQHNRWWTEKILPEDRERVDRDYNLFIEQKNTHIWTEEYRIVLEDGKIRHMLDRGYLLFDKNKNPVRMIGSVEDITERKIYEQQLEELNVELKRRMEELALSNAELEQFAYVASHDLQEPLRMVSRFLSEIERKYNDKLDDKGREYIHFAVDGAKRMRILILDLLEYSRLGKTEYKIETFKVSEILDEVVKFLNINPLDTNASVTWDEMPEITGRRTPLVLVFQNLLGNAIKYCKPDTLCEVRISVEDLGSHYQFCVSDNGIGINPEFFDRIFVIFQRLHGKQEFTGTGIGLAICKKIVESMKGKIWVESEEGKGSQFYFTVPK